MAQQTAAKQRPVVDMWPRAMNNITLYTATGTHDISMVWGNKATNSIVTGVKM